MFWTKYNKEAVDRLFLRLGYDENYSEADAAGRAFAASI